MTFKEIILWNLLIVFLGSVSALAETAIKAHNDCTVCHVDAISDPGKLKAGPNELCLTCHQSSKGNDHPVGIVPALKPRELPLDKENRITCVTCHEPHGKQPYDRLLRMEFNSLCKSCHKV